MAKKYEPELGQAVFGQPFKKYECPDHIEALLSYIGYELERVMHNNGVHDFNNPFGNTGADFKNDVFEVDAYDWGNEEQPYNFKWRDFEVSWYKYLGRGMSCNRELKPKEAIEMFNECLKSVLDIEKEDK